MGKDQDLLQAVKDQDYGSLLRILNKHKTSKKLIGSGKRLNLNHQDNDGMSALHQAALVGQTDIMSALLDGGASVDIKDVKGMRPLHYAAWQGKEEPVAILLKWGATPNEPALDGETPTHLACQHGHYEVVNQLLRHNADPTITNNHLKSPLDLACEFGRYKVTNLLLNSTLCDRLLVERPADMADNNRTTCLHLAAKNGHQDIIRLLLNAGVDINRQTLQGTCLHEAALCGKIDVVKLLLDCGVDVNRPNSYDQTALDIVNKFTTSRAAKELKQLLKEASFAVHARAVEDFSNVYDPSSLTFKEGDYITVLEQRPDGIWKGYVMHDGQGVKTGYFPSNAVVLVDKQTVSNRSMSRQGSMTHPHHVRIPHVPDLINSNPQNTLSRSSQNSLNHNHHEQNSYSIGADDSFPPPPSPLMVAKTQSRDMESVHNLTYSQLQQTSNRLNNVNSDKTAEWLGSYPDGVDGHLVSPCKDSPGSSNRNSAASLGSGSSHSGHMATHNYVNIQISNQQNRLSGQSYESGVSTSSQQSYDSTSSSSLGSLDRLEESGYSSTVNVHELFQAGVSQDTEVIHAWLQDLHFEEYFNNFVQAGYDMPTITRMTPEDLTAIGIQKPAHRKRLKAEISRLHLHDGIPDYKPVDLVEWLRLLNLDQYYDTLVSQGFGDLDSITDITWEDLEEIGIKKLGHQKKIMLAIDRLKRIQSGLKRLSSATERRGSTEMLDPPSSARWSGDLHHTRQPSPHFGHDVMASPCRMPSGDSINTTGSELRSFQNPRDEENARSFAAEIVHMRQNKAPAPYKPDVVAIQVRSPLKGSSMEALDKDKQVTYHSFHGPIETRTYIDGVDSVDANSNVDGDVTPTNERGGTPSDEIDGCSTLRRPAAMVSPRPKPKPVAKIVAKSKRMSQEVPSDIIMLEKTESHEILNKTGTLSKSAVPSLSSQSELIYAQPVVSCQAPQSPLPQQGRGSLNSSPSHSPTHYALSPVKNKRMPPPPPKRTNSIKCTDNLSVQQALEAKRAELKQADVFTPHLHQQHQHSQQQQTQQQQQQPPPAPPPPPPPLPVLTTQTVPMSASLPAPGSTSLSSTVIKSAPGGEQNNNPTPPVQQTNYSNCVKSLTNKFNKPELKPVSSPAKTVSSPAKPVSSLAKPVSAPAKPVSAPAKPVSSPAKTTTTAQPPPPPSPGEDFPPPPPPIAMEIITPYKGQLHNQTKQAEAKSSSGGSSEGWSGEDGSATVRRIKVKEESSTLTSSDRDSSSSTSSIDSNTSTSSIDSNTLPFANENVGTIKQRAPPNKPSILSTGADVDSGDRNLDSSLFEDNTGTIKRTSSPLHRAEGRRMPPQTPRRPDLPATDVIASDGLAAVSAKESGDVLNDIGNMLQDLTDELDAMLECELDD